jgi:NAD(P)-dependent dehydrogenase (short-subunit alcohol dehydrogenase family)
MADLDGRVCVVTGASSGIGKATALALAAQGATVAMVARDRGRGEQARAEIAEVTGNDRVDLVLSDLSSQNQVRRLADHLLSGYDALHVLINNAGLTLSERRLSEDGIEATFAINHLAPFLLTNLVRDRLLGSVPARVVTVASEAHQAGRIEFDDLSGERRFSGWFAYAQSKLANILFTFELARRLAGTGVTANCMHPGVVSTNFGREGPLHFRLFFRIAGFLLLTPERGADTTVWLASSPEVEHETGGYYIKRRRVQPSLVARDPRTARRLWQVSAGLVGLPADRPTEVPPE